MNHPLSLCVACNRHVRRSDSACPFCGLDRVDEPSPAQEELPSRLSRAAMILGASMAFGCPSASVYGGPPMPPPRSPDAAVPHAQTSPQTPQEPAHATPTTAPSQPPPLGQASLAGAYGAPPPRDLAAPRR